MNEDIILMLSGWEEMKMHLDEIPHKEFLDMMVYYLVARDGGTTQSRRRVDLHTLDCEEARARGIFDEEELFRTAMVNTRRCFPPQITDMHDGMYCLTNRQNCFGATAMLYDDMLREVSECAGTGLYIIPLNIHEVICIRQDIADPADIYDFVSKGNEQYVDEKEFLSNSIYYYDTDKAKLVVAYSQDGYYM